MADPQRRMVEAVTNKQTYRRVYADGTVLHTKLGIHARYSSISTDISAAIAYEIGAPNELAVLDIGCGTGHLIEHLAALGHRGQLIGLDLVRPPIADTEHKQYCAGDAEALPFRDATFDVATCVHTLSHIIDLPAAMCEARRVLRPSGRYLATANSLTSYPHTAAYRARTHHEFGWGEPIFTTSRVNLECLTETLAPYWRTVKLRVLAGELRIPRPEYVTYFAANIPTWAHRPTTAERMEILTRVERWSAADQHDGYIIELKRVGLAVCAN